MAYTRAQGSVRELGDRRILPGVCGGSSSSTTRARADPDRTESGEAALLSLAQRAQIPAPLQAHSRRWDPTSSLVGEWASSPQV